MFLKSILQSVLIKPKFGKLYFFIQEIVCLIIRQKINFTLFYRLLSSFNIYISGQKLLDTFIQHTRLLQFLGAPQVLLYNSPWLIMLDNSKAKSSKLKLLFMLVNYYHTTFKFS